MEIVLETVGCRLVVLRSWASGHRLEILRRAPGRPLQSCTATPGRAARRFASPRSKSRHADADQRLDKPVDIGASSAVCVLGMTYACRADASA